MLDQQRKFTSVPDNPSWKINDAKKLDLKQIFDILLKEDDRGNFVDPRSELSEAARRVRSGRFRDARMMDAAPPKRLSNASHKMA
ncbi:hypothetical protein Aduo_018810 [Ancylostoma duodenale]